MRGSNEGSDRKPPAKERSHRLQTDVDSDLPVIVRRVRQHLGTERGEREYERIVDLLYEKSVQFAYRRVGRNQDAVEIANYALWRAWRSFEMYREEEGPFTSWYFQLLANEVVEHLRRERQIRMPKERRPTFVGYDESTYDLAARAESLDLRLDLAKRIEALPGHLREVFELRFHDDHTILEVARILGWSTRWVNERLREIKAEMEPLRR